jgi:hypothetical protein
MTRRKRPRASAPLGEGRSAFAYLLDGLVQRCPGARAASLVDADGEAVDYVGELDPFEVRVASAHWRLVLSHSPQPIRELRLRCRTAGYVVRALADDYALVVLFTPRAALTASPLALGWAEHAIAREAGWPAPSHEQWHPVVVDQGPARRPVALASPKGRRSIEVLGVLPGSPPKGHAFWVRVENGGEGALRREPGGAWYADNLLAGEPTVPHFAGARARGRKEI